MNLVQFGRSKSLPAPEVFPKGLCNAGTLAIQTMLAPATGGPLSSGPGREAAASLGVVAEELGADPAVVEAGVRAAVRLALGVQGEAGSRELEGAGQGVGGGVGGVVQTGGRAGPQEVLHLLDGAGGPVEAPGGPPQVAHHKAVPPGAGLGPRTGPQVGGRGVPVVYGPEQVADLVGGHHHPAVGAAVLHQGDAGDLGEPAVADTGAAHVGVAGSVAVHPALLVPGHVQSGERDDHVVDRQGGPTNTPYTHPTYILTHVGSL